MGVSTDITVTPGQTVSVSGDGALEWAPRWGSGGFDVQARGSLSLTYIGLSPEASITLNSGGSLSVALMAVSVATLSGAMSELGGAGSSLRFEDITVLEYHYDPAQTVAITVNDDGTKTHEGSLSFGRPVFNVSSGPCEISQGGRCVGRPQGYLPTEDCAITVSGGGGVLAPCSVFDMDGFGSASGDIVTVLGQVHSNSDCPTGVALSTDNTVSWFSDDFGQGNPDWYLLGYPDGNGNGCGPKGICGPAAWSRTEVGGGWELCFVPPVPGCTNPTASDYNPSATVEDGSCTSGTPFRVGVKWEVWDGYGGGFAVASLTSSPEYIADTPTATDFLTPPAVFGMDFVRDHLFGARLTTYFLAPQTGDYTFVMAADDQGELWLGRDESTLQLIITANSGTSRNWDWDRDPSQMSTPQRLTAGRYYLLRALEKN
eukprot:COSAG06_NODE_1475_length_9337_cov_6.585733_1_plen_429_part_10